MSLRDLDDRMLGARGVLVAALLSLTGLVGIAGSLRGDVAAAIVGFVVAIWAGYWSARRWQRLIRA